MEMARVRQFEKGETICREGEECPGVFIVGNGLVRIYKLAPSGKEHVLHLVGPGSTFLEVAAILEMDCPAHSEAIEPTTCVLLPAGPFMRALKEDHPLCLQLLGGMALRVRHFVGMLEDIVLRDALARVATHLLKAGGGQGQTVNLPSLKKHLASHLNLTSETLSRCLRQLLDAGIVQSGEGQGLRVTDAKALREVAEGMFPRV